MQVSESTSATPAKDTCFSSYHHDSATPDLSNSHSSTHYHESAH